MEQFEVEIVEADRTATLALRGEIDLAAVEAVATNGREILAIDADHLVLDLSATSFLDSSGLNAILAFHNAARAADRSVELVPGPAAVARVLDLVGLSGVFDPPE